MALEAAEIESRKASLSMKTETSQQPTSVFSTNEPQMTQETMTWLDKEKKEVSKNLHQYRSVSCDKPFLMDVDILDAVSSHSQERRNDSTTEICSSQPDISKVEDISTQDKKADKSSAKYWVDEEDRYPPQMSLSPVIGRSILRKASKEIKREKKEKKKDLVKRVDTERKQSTKTHLKLTQRRNTTRLNPILTKPPDNHQAQNNNSPTGQTKISPDVTRLLKNQPSSTKPVRNQNGHNLLFSTKSAPTSVKNVYKRDFHVPSETYNLSPSLVRPILTTSPTTSQASKSSNNGDRLFSTATNKQKQDTLFFSQRVAMPHRQVSRSKSTNTSTTKVPELPRISARRSSKSISDFRQSSSIFGKLVRKNASKESVKELEKTNKATSKLNKGSTSKNNETTRQKLSRILSFN